MLQSNSLVKVGFIRKPHGLQGFVKMQALTDFVEERFQIGEVFFLEDEQDRVKLEDIKSQKDGFLVKFEGIDTVEDAEALRGLYLLIPKDYRQDLDNSSFYPDQLQGMFVFVGEKELGRVVKLELYPANPVLIVKGEESSFQIPFVKAAIKEVDKKAGRIVLTGMGYAY